MNMKSSSRIVAISALTALVAVTIIGCVKPGRMDPSVVSRYQAAMFHKGPQTRSQDDPLGSYLPAAGTTGPALTFVTDETGQDTVNLSLQEAILRGLANNVDVRVVSYNPEIAQEEVIQAAAEFDYVFFADASMAHIDEFLSGVFSGTPNNRKENLGRVGVRQTTITGAQWSLAYEMIWDRNRSARPTFKTWTPNLVAEITQPLLRGGWMERNLAGLRIARLNRDTSAAQFREQVQQTVADIITAYWRLVQSRRDLEGGELLLKATQETLDRIIARQDIDTSDVQVKQTEAAVYRREADLVRAKKFVRDAQDTLGRLLADAQINTLINAEIIPIDQPSESEILIDEADQLATALIHSPFLEQARIGIAGADVNVRVAQNELLPRLDLTAGGQVNGQGSTWRKAHDSFNTYDQINWNLQLAFEYPIGNRERKALLRQRKAEKLQSVTELQNTVDEVAQLVRERIREARTAHREIIIQRLASQAAQDQLQALEHTETIRGALTPEFLQVKLSAHETIAIAERALIQAIVDYNIALAEINRATGTILEMHRVQVALPVAEGASPWPDGQFD